MSFHGLCPFLNWVICFLAVEFCLLDTNPFSDVLFANIVSRVLDCFSPLLAIATYDFWLKNSQSWEMAQWVKSLTCKLEDPSSNPSLKPLQNRLSGNMQAHLAFVAIILS